MQMLTDSQKKEIPEAVYRKVGAMEEVAQLSFVEEFQKKRKIPRLALLLAMSGGLHYAYLGKWWLCILFFFTLGGFGLWWFISVFRAMGLVREYNRSVAIHVLRDIQILH